MATQLTINTLTKLISFDTTSVHSNLELMAYIQSFLNEYGVESTLDYNQEKTKANLYATIGPIEKPGILLSGHTDTVPVKGQSWSTDPFKLTFLDSKAFGRGTADMKSFIAVALASVPKMLSANLTKPIHFAFSYDEEIGCLGVRSLIEKLKHLDVKPAACIVGEPTEMKLVTSHKGKLAARVTVTGKECHSGMAPHGVNAVNYAARLVNWLENAANDKAQNGPFHTQYDIPYSTIHTGIIQGGTALNIVPNHCQFDFEIRNIADDNPQDLLGHFADYCQELIGEMTQKASDTDIAIEVLTEYPGLAKSNDDAIISYLKNLTDDAEEGQINFGTEGGLFSERLKLPTVVCGPGSMQQGHKPDEFIYIEQLAKSEAFIERLIDSLSESP
ncbi:acetylornithine deacetylase [Marinomonas balearica]|uniref:Acetylornithine deacetylase n=1 Tax=Marinomonas balearica TaxID=491947 RepID=A0A4V3CGJ6_9GAMM|nr:acetylornithine deacetylase [Marinomonas balearica]TDO97962.1 acetylornithine deacetylase [Marinomonas balearica]